MQNANQPRIEPFDGDVDLYTDDQVNGGQTEAPATDDEGPRTLTWMAQDSEPPRAAKTHSNGMSSLPSLSTALSPGQHVCISTLSCQLAKTSPVESAKMAGLCKELVFNRSDPSQSLHHSLQLEVTDLSSQDAESTPLCSCLQSSTLYPKYCGECRTLHNFSCAFLEDCYLKGHRVSTDGATHESGAVPPQGVRLGVSDMSTSQPFTSSSGAAMTSSSMSDGPKSITPPRRPITYHDCCNLGQPDPQVLCVSCGVFHSHSCAGRDYCNVRHTLKQLGVCICGKPCSRKPLVLCRYCGKEYCNDCWYRRPVECDCGQTFDQSTSV